MPKVHGNTDVCHATKIASADLLAAGKAGSIWISGGHKSLPREKLVYRTSANPLRVFSNHNKPAQATNAAMV